MVASSTKAGRSAPTPGKGSGLQTPVRRVFLHGAIASMSTTFDAMVTKIARHDVVIRLTAGGEPFDVEIGAYKGPATAVVLPPMQRHSVRSRGPGFITLILHVIHPRFRTARDFLDGSVLLLSHAPFAPLASRMHAACRNTMSVEDACDLMDDLLDVVLADAVRAPPLDQRIPWVMRKLDANIDHPFEQLAAELGLSASRLSHLFSQELGLSFRSYQAWARLRQAWEMIVQRPEMSIAEIAGVAGFADAAHLSRTCHNSLGFTPSMMRDMRLMEVIGDGLPPGQHIPSDAEMKRS